MSIFRTGHLVVCILLLKLTTAYAGYNPHDNLRVEISFVEFQSINLENNSEVLTIKGKLQLPAQKNCHHRDKFNRFKCRSEKLLPAVVILHDAAGVDSRGDFYAQKLNQAGIATLEIDMWEARGITSTADCPALPMYTYPDAFAALTYLSQRSDIDPERIGVMGFSWGGIVTLATATETNVATYGNGLKFAAHAANYPLCYLFNSPLPGSEFYNLTGAPILVQIGEKDDYDMSSAPCQAVKASLTDEEQSNFEVVSYSDAYHDFDRLKVPTSLMVPYANLGSGGKVNLIPNVNAAYKSRDKIVAFFSRNLFDKKHF